MSGHIPLLEEKHGKTKLFLTLSSTQGPKEPHSTAILNHPFNYQADIVIPHCADANSVSRDLLLTLTQNVAYKVKLSLSHFITPDFISKYIKNGMLIALRAGQFIDEGDVFAIDGRGNLILSLTKDTYQEAGLTGEAIKFPAEKSHRHMVVIDLKLDAMQPKRPYYERVRWSFENVLNKEYEFLVAYFDSVTGESAPIEFPESSEAKQIPTAVTTKILDDVKIPTTEVVWDHSLASANSRKGGALLTGAEVWQSDCYDVYEWLGMVSIESERIAATDRVDPFVSVYSVPEPHAQGPVCLVRCTGMLSARALLRAMETLSERHGIVGITVWGFEDAPISWYSHIHSYYLSGENMYAQIRNKEKKMCLTFQACCPYDTFS